MARPYLIPDITIANDSAKPQAIRVHSMIRYVSFEGIKRFIMTRI
jgi:hypothetical protein